MKLIKKIAAIMLSIMMVLGIASVVSAAEGAETGTITINSAIKDQTYTIYKMLTLESYDEAKGLYSYKPATEEWKTFFTEGEGKGYVDINENGYVTWKTVEGEDTAKKEARAAELAQKALTYATTKRVSNAGQKTATGTRVTFDNLSLGYYLVDSSLGALCSLNTTNPTATITEKNGKPTVDKKIDVNGNLQEMNQANIGDTITFETHINVKKGAKNYILYDNMSDGLKLTTINTGHHDFPIHIKIENGTELSDVQDYIFSKIDDHHFKVTFTDAFLKSHENEEYKLIVRYNAILTGDAVINQGNTNTTYLTYGDSNTKTNEAETTTITYQIPVLKYTGDINHPLADAKFKLYDSETGTNPIDLIQKTGTQDYRKALWNETGSINEITTNETGKFNIQGLKPGTYWLEESAAPKGYNKLTKRIRVDIDENGMMTINTTERFKTEVAVENKSGTILPSTGGMGTTVIYLAGALLVMISGVVLIAKKRASQK